MSDEPSTNPSSPKLGDLTPLSLADRPAVVKRYGEMAAQLGIAPPPLLRVHKHYPNLFAYPKMDPPSIGITPPALELLDDRELVALLGHELSHIVRKDERKLTQVGAYTAGALVAGGASLGIGLFTVHHAMDRIAQRPLPDNLPPERAERTATRRAVLAGAGLGFATVALSGTALAKGGALAAETSEHPINQHFERLADRDAAMLSDPEALASAFRKLSVWYHQHGLTFDTVKHLGLDERLSALGDGLRR